jgi:uncharacterized protein YbjT (DUF2867 family)
MKILIFGATGMVGQGVLRECLADPAVDRVVTVGRSPSGRTHPKLEELILANLFAIAGLEKALRGFDACFFCLGISSLGVDEADYRRTTHDLTMKIAEVLLRASPGLTFIYVSGAGTDSSGAGKVMWARIKGETENALRAMPFKATYLFRPGFIQPLDGIISKTRWIRLIYAITAPISAPLARIAPGLVTTTRSIGRAMIRVARQGFARPVITSADINRLG